MTAGEGFLGPPRSIDSAAKPSEEGIGMTMTATHHTIGLTGVRLLGSAFNAWLLSVASSFTLIIIRQNALPPAEDLVTVRQIDAATLAVVITITAAVFLWRERDSLRYPQALIVGVFWAGLSTVSLAIYRSHIDEYHALRILLDLMCGDSDPASGWVWSMFLTLQMITIPALKVLRDALSPRAGRPEGRGQRHAGPASCDNRAS